MTASGAVGNTMRFEEFLRGPDSVPAGEAEESASLAGMEYADELALKERALAQWWRAAELPGQPERIVPAPLPRRYRTTTKRRVVVEGTDAALHIGGGGKAQELFALLEPETHAALYDHIGAQLRTGRFKALVRELNWVIVRGSYVELTVICNVRRLDGPIVKKLKGLDGDVRAFEKRVASCFAFVDPTRSRYYLDTRPIEGPLKIKRLSGAGAIYVKFDGAKYCFAPEVFSQVNHAMVPELLARTRALLAPDGAERLMDLYCGYGLFTHFLANDYAESVGVESEHAAVQSAHASAEFFAHARPVRFKVCRIGPHTLRAALPGPDNRPEAVLVDPPRGGCAPGVIPLLAERRPRKVLHLCCGIDVLPRELAAWSSEGYVPAQIVPLDMFAGTPNLEIMALLSPADESSARASRGGSRASRD